MCNMNGGGLLIRIIFALVIEYHDAFTQTGPLVDEEKMERMVTRDTQTAEPRSSMATVSHTCIILSITIAIR